MYLNKASVMEKRTIRRHIITGAFQKSRGSLHKQHKNSRIQEIVAARRASFPLTVASQWRLLTFQGKCQQLVKHGKVVPRHGCIASRIWLSTAVGSRVAGRIHPPWMLDVAAKFFHGVVKSVVPSDNLLLRNSIRYSINTLLDPTCSRNDSTSRHVHGN